MIFPTIFRFEIRNWIRHPGTYLYAAVFFIFALIAFLGTGGFFDAPVSESAGNVRLLNSHFEINYLFQYLGKLFLFLLPALCGAAIYNDFKYNVHPVLYTYPVDKGIYLSAKFLGSFVIVVAIALFTGLAFVLGEYLLGTGNPRIGDFNPESYIQAFVFFVIPNLFVSGVFVFAVVALSRNIFSGFIVVLLLFSVQLIAENLFQGTPFLVALSDPFGQNAVAFETRFWTLAEQNSMMIPVNGIVLYNRLTWLVISLFTGLFLLRNFSMSYHQRPFFSRKKNRPGREREFQKNPTMISGRELKLDFSFKQWVFTTWDFSRMEFRYLITHPMFAVFTIAGILSVIFMLLRVTEAGEMVMLPLTRLILSVPAFFYGTIVILITFIYSGMLVHRDRLSGMEALVNCTPVPTAVLMGSRVIALVKMQYLLLTVLMITGVGLQFYFGFFEVDLLQYLFNLFIISGLSLIIWSLLSVSVHALAPNLYSGLFVLFMIWIGKDQLSNFGITSYLFSFNSPPQLLFSDINGYGPLLKGYFLVEAYWLLITSVFLLLGYIFWRREYVFSLPEWLSLGISRLNRSVLAAFIVLVSGIGWLGYVIYKAEQLPEGINLSRQVTEQFKERFESYENLPQPRITSIQLKMDLYPERNSFRATGRYLLVNKTSSSIDTLLIRTGFDEMTEYTLKSENERVVFDRYMKFNVHRLKDPLVPGDSLYLSFDIKNHPNTLLQKNSGVLKNGTFLRHDIMPRLGYFLSSGKIDSSKSADVNNHYQAIDSDLVDYDFVIGTSSGQKAIAPGILQNQWKEEGRNYYHFKTEKPVKMGFSINSGVFETKRSRRDSVSLEIHYHPSHTYNTGSMMNGLEAALEYNSQNFGPYQHGEMKIVEFPISEGSFATTFANVIQISEVRFGVNSERDEKIDLSFYVTAHEMTHQWFGNQLLPKDAPGALMLTESLTEYVTLQIYKKQFGDERAFQFLAIQRLRYLSGRTSAAEDEVPLGFVTPGQDYISYGKGAFAFNTLAHFVGEESLNQMIREFLEDFPADNRTYPTSADFLNHLKNNVPDNVQRLIEDLFEKIIFHEAELLAAEIETAEGDYELQITVSLKKFQDGFTNEMTMNDEPLEIGFYDDEDRLISLQQLRISENRNEISFRLSEKPRKVVLDPNMLLIEKSLENNIHIF